MPDNGVSVTEVILEQLNQHGQKLDTMLEQLTRIETCEESLQKVVDTHLEDHRTNMKEKSSRGFNMFLIGITTVLAVVEAWIVTRLGIK